MKIIGKMPVVNVNDEIIPNKLINPKLKNGSPSVARRTQNNIKLLFDFTRDLGIIDINPSSKIKASKIYNDKPRKRHLTMDEIRTFLNLIYSAAIKTQYKFAFHLSLLLLTRKTEIYLTLAI